MGVVFVEPHRRHRAVLERFRQGGQMRRDALPVVERRLQGWREERGVRVPRKVARNHDQPSVTLSVLQCRKFHAGPFPSRS